MASNGWKIDVLPFGDLQPDQPVGEYVAQAAERETREETGYDVKVVGLVGIYSDPTT